MNCIKCGAEIPESSNFCNICGARQAVPVKGTKKRGNGQGTVYKRGNTWAAQVTLGYYIKDGKRKRKTAQKYGFKTKKEAVAYINTLFSPSEKIRVITLSELWGLFSANLDTLSASTRTKYRISWKKIETDVAYRKIDSLTVPELQAITDKAASTYDTKRSIKLLLSQLYKIAIRDDYVDKNKAEYIQLPTHTTAERQIFTAAEIDMLWADFKAAKSRIIAGMLTMLYTGMRPGELLKIRLENVHLSEHYMTGGIKTEKGKKRKIIIPDKLRPVLEYLIAEERNGKLLYYRHDNDFYTEYKEAAARLYLRSELSPYCCRHTYITNLTALKVSPAMLQELAGHEDYDTTLMYTHLSIEDRLKEVNRL